LNIQTIIHPITIRLENLEYKVRLSLLRAPTRNQNQLNFHLQAHPHLRLHLSLLFLPLLFLPLLFLLRHLDEKLGLSCIQTLWLQFFPLKLELQLERPQLATWR